MPLEELELIVDEAVPGHFYWIVLGPEVFGEPRNVLAYAPGPSRTHQHALDQGAAALERHRDHVSAASPTQYARPMKVKRNWTGSGVLINRDSSDSLIA